MEKIYLDHAASEPVRKEILDELKVIASFPANASSAHSEGKKKRNMIENARKLIADEIGTIPDNIIFTSGASEANALGMNVCLVKEGWKAIDTCIVSPIEHDSILLKATTFRSHRIFNVDRYGYVDLNSLEDYLAETYRDKVKPLVCVQHANNEIGCIQDIKAISELTHLYGGYLLVDAAQTFGKININVKKMGIDMLSASGGKMGALKGSGFLYVNKELLMPKSLICGTQENFIRGGTYNDLAIWSLGKAVELIDYKENTVLDLRRNYLVEHLLENKEVWLVGKRTNRIGNNVFIRISNMDIDSQQLVGILDMYGYEVSAGSACNSGNKEISHVLKAVGLSDEEAKTCIRISIGMENSVDDLRNFADTLKQIINMHRKEDEK